MPAEYVSTTRAGPRAASGPDRTPGFRDRLCTLYLALADTWLKKGQPQQAIFYLERVAQGFPNTRHAEEAQVRLSRLRGSPGKRAGTKSTSGS